MAVRRVRNPKPLHRLRAAHVARVRRTAEKVREGKVAIEDVAPDIREEVDVRTRVRAQGELL